MVGLIEEIFLANPLEWLTLIATVGGGVIAWYYRKNTNRANLMNARIDSNWSQMSDLIDKQDVRIAQLEKRLGTAILEIDDLRRSVQERDNYIQYLLSGFALWIEYAKKQRRKIVFIPVTLEAFRNNEHVERDTKGHSARFNWGGNPPES